MGKGVAVVFDSAGTLMRMYRVAKEHDTGSIIEDVQTTLLVSQAPGRALVVIRSWFEQINNCDSKMLLRDFIEHYGISLGISCASSPFEVEEIYSIVQKSDVRVNDILEVVSTVRCHCPDISFVAAGIIVDSQKTPVPYVLSTGGRMYSNTPRTIDSIREMGADVYIASGDDYPGLELIASSVGIPMSYVYGVATTRDKERIIRELKQSYDSVVMVGDGMNDILALRAADVGIMTVQQGDERPSVLRDAADVIIDDIFDVVNIVAGI
ncbi:HAD family hydrolase [Methanolobus sp. ZRKC3]|uniref:HAD family hydrolase n=1 Tax=Methanolobus sp. ZRKC3 TaxID=3125786 RepID=UPI003247BFAE